MYYRATVENLGDRITLEPTGLYEAVTDDGFIEFMVDDVIMKSSIPETCASKSIIGACIGLISMLRMNRIKASRFYIYMIEEQPDIDLSELDYLDFSIIKEVRYRKAVNAMLYCSGTFKDKLLSHVDSMYEIISSDPYVETEEQDIEKFKKLIERINHIPEWVNINLIS